MGAGYAFGAAVHELGHSMKAADAKAYAKFESAVLGLAQSDAALEQIARQTAADYLSPDSPARAGLLDAQGNIAAVDIRDFTTRVGYLYNVRADAQGHIYAIACDYKKPIAVVPFEDLPAHDDPGLILE